MSRFIFNGLLSLKKGRDLHDAQYQKAALIEAVLLSFNQLTVF